MNVLGIHDGHNASACLVVDGRVVYCIQEERLTSRKNYFGFPSRSVKTILALADLRPEDVDFVAMGSLHTPKLTGDTTGSYEKQASRLWSLAVEAAMKTPIYTVYKNRAREERFRNLRQASLEGGKAVFVDHHLCHAASAYYGAPWKEEKVLVLTCDGSGDELCATVSVGEKGALHKIAETPRGHSLGDIYSRVTFLLGLVPLEHEWKVMGLAPYSPESGMRKSYDVFTRYLAVDGKGLTFRRSIPEPTQMIYARLRRDLELHRFDWISAGVQKFAEDLLLAWVGRAVATTGIRKLAAAGGVFMNVKANKLLLEMEEVDDLFVFPSCGDESISIGAAFNVYAQKCRESGRDVDIPPLADIYYGPDFTDDQVKASILEAERRGLALRYEQVTDMETRVAELLAKGEIVARCKGRMEFGARALGNRSILADPSRFECVRTINMMVKKRDFWMPFAPVIRKERQEEYIMNPKGTKAPYMILSFDSTDRRNEMIAAVHQADLTARPQVLEKGWNPAYYAILEEFERLTGRGVLLNTSFNLHGYPMVYGPDEALWVFENSDLCYLALGNYLVTKD